MRASAAIAAAIALASPARGSAAGEDVAGEPTAAPTAPPEASPFRADVAGSPEAGAPAAASPPPGTAGTPPEIRAAPPAEIVGSESGARHELDEARRLLDEGEEAPDDATRRSRYEAARDHAARAVAAMPKSADAHFVHFAAAGRLAQMKGVAKLAIEIIDLNKELDLVLELDPDHANALAARGGMFMRLPRLLGGDKSKGVAYLERAVALDATAIGKRLELAEAYRAIGRDGDAARVAADARRVAVAEHREDKVAACDKFLADVRRDCPACAPGGDGPGSRQAPAAPAAPEAPATPTTSP